MRSAWFAATGLVDYELKLRSVSDIVSFLQDGKARDDKNTEAIFPSD